MALFEMKFQPGVNKQDTGVGATDRWVDSDNVRWRYGLAEKVGVDGNIVTNKRRQQTPECQSAYDEGVMVGSADGLSWALDRIEQESEEYLAEEEF